MAVELEKGSYLSSDGKTRISYKKWADGEAPARAVLQIAHGMAEYVQRYDAFARFMAENGFAVLGNDHLGHGDSAEGADGLGYIAEKDGYKLLAADVKKLSDLAREQYPGLPLILLGHSMGSFVARLYAAAYPAAADALILSGTSGPNPASGAGALVASLMAALKGERYRSGFVDRLAFGSYNNNCPEKRTPFDWLSQNAENVERYVADERCGFVFTLSAFRDLFKLLGAVSEKGWAARLRKNLPVLLISGQYDPVGGYGEGVKVVRERLEAAGVSDVKLKLYDGMRHEILNETGKERVWGDLLAWCSARFR